MTSSTTRRRSTGLAMTGLSGSPTFESSSRSSITFTIRWAPRSMAASEPAVRSERSGEDPSISRWPSTDDSGFLSSWATVAISWPL